MTLTERKSRFTLLRRAVSKQAAKVADAPAQLTDSQHHRKRSREDRRKRREEEKRREEAEAVEQRIHVLESELAEISTALERASQSQQLNQVQRLGERYVQIEREMERLFEDWAALA